MARNNFLMALASGAMLWLLSAAVPANAQCCAPPPPPPPPCCTAPPPPCCQPPPPPPRPNNPNCCTPRHDVIIPGINVFVAPSVIVNARASAVAVAGAGAGAGAAVYYGGGGGGGGIMPPSSTGVIQGLDVQGAMKKKRVAYEATRTRTRRVVIRAVCIDDRDVPHPASQITPDRDIEGAYDGELYRCIAGSYLQITVAEFSGDVSFDKGGETMVCRKGEALWHSPGGPDGGLMDCRPAKPGRDCYERSLLRRYGAGVKVLTIVSTETYTAYREETVQESSTGSYSMSLDGGVGGTVY